MTFDDKIIQLRGIIDQQLDFIDGINAAIFGLPLHGNTGDTLIALGQYSFLKAHHVNIISERLLIDISSLPDLPKDCYILLQGGGDFGDVWRGIQDARMRIIQKYRTHHIVIFPQTVFYQNDQLLYQDLDILSRCPNITMCVRDKRSFELMSSFLKDHVILVPDMAFYLPDSRIEPYVMSEKDDNLFLIRRDCELKESKLFVSSHSSDWPTFETPPWYLKLSLRMVGISEAFRLRNINRIFRWIRVINIIYIKRIVYPLILINGIRFLSSHKNLYLSRMHACILAVLMRRKFTMIDNSYGKNSSFYYTWFSDLEGANLNSE